MLGYDNYYFFFRKGGIQDIAHPFVGPWHWLFGIIGPTVLLHPDQSALTDEFDGNPCGCNGKSCLFLRLLSATTTFVRSVAIASIAGCSFTALCLSFTCEYYIQFFLPRPLSLSSRTRPNAIRSLSEAHGLGFSLYHRRNHPDQCSETDFACYCKNHTRKDPICPTTSSLLHNIADCLSHCLQGCICSTSRWPELDRARRSRHF